MSNSFKLPPKHFSNGGEKISCTPYLRACFGGQLCPSPYTFLARQSHFSHLNQKSFAQRKEMTLDHKLKTLGSSCFRLILPLGGPYIAPWRALYCPSEGLILPLGGPYIALRRALYCPSEFILPLLSKSDKKKFA